jgi:hypothetical protein
MHLTLRERRATPFRRAERREADIVEMRNLTQSTYDRIVQDLRNTGDRWARRPHTLDAKDLLEAYEAAVTLLDKALECAGMDMGTDLEQEVASFLYLDNGEPRVELDSEELVSHNI